MALNEHKTKILIALLQELEWPLDPRIFRALLPRVVSVPLELAVLNENGHVLTFYRKDDEYDGHHIPGTVLRNNENVSQALSRFVSGEVVGGEISEPKSIGWVEIPKGDGVRENPTRHEISLLFLARMIGEYQGKGGVFSPLDELPENTLPHHRMLVEKVQQFLVTRKPILGK